MMVDEGFVGRLGVMLLLLGACTVAGVVDQWVGVARIVPEQKALRADALRLVQENPVLAEGVTAGGSSDEAEWRHSTRSRLVFEGLVACYWTLCAAGLLLVGWQVLRAKGHLRRAGVLCLVCAGLAIPALLTYVWMACWFGQLGAQVEQTRVAHHLNPEQEARVKAMDEEARAQMPGVREITDRAHGYPGWAELFVLLWALVLVVCTWGGVKLLRSGDKPRAGPARVGPRRAR